MPYLLTKFHIKLANQRKDYFFKLANTIAKEYDNVFIEDLNIKAMAKLWGRKINDLNLKGRIFECPNCNVKLDRDYNASLNIYRVGASTLRGESIRPTKVG
ncbi:hypothetical protein C3H94_02570 [Campylobacter jejuni]|uniref:Uncharacterized protein n=1 Tax=Campylobacter jejuni TaxID=197 RepID=A0A430WQE9_CAMJU|nr:hypothetical protein C3I15_01490 [Campylobacter jejuni]RTI84097.1 hypothetical protein C3I10_00030 [Campylobacter jejuni]RTJ05665.1 hypothetical protein C3H99_03270 [Campylobacter jejuni]RTJ08434.1 hypothetical protein C3H94_02570 [Campylobacter jejuni]RTJ47253.1 hypothetical protein C3H68_04240 [Campylobacter jejuni]